MPYNGTTNRQYRGINVFILQMTAILSGYSSNAWASYRQIKKAGGQVRKGEKGTTIVFYDRFKRVKDEDDPTGETYRVVPREFPLLRYYTVFNADQADDWQPDETQATDIASDEVAPAGRVEFILEHSGVGLVHRPGQQPHYLPQLDRIELPPVEQFDHRTAYQHTALHELAHATGHSTRLDRGLDALKSKSGAAYAREELVAEMASMLAGAHLGVGSSPQNSHSYIGSWVALLESKESEIMDAASRAQAACDWIVNVESKKEAA